MAKQLIKVSALEVNRYGFFLAIDSQYMMLIFLPDIFGLIYPPFISKKRVEHLFIAGYNMVVVVVVVVVV